MRMARKSVSLSVALLLCVLLISVEMEGAEGRTCKSQSHSFKGYCVSNSNCKNVCRTEKFPNGSCDFHVTSRKCFCYKPC